MTEMCRICKTEYRLLKDVQKCNQCKDIKCNECISSKKCMKMLQLKSPTNKLILITCCNDCNFYNINK